jgi:predicted GH43/DUF377 family glycosyl hydrolase
MKKNLYYSLIILFIFSGCSKENPVEPNPENTTGSIVFKIDRENAPSTVVVVEAILRRSGFNSITSQLNLLSDSTADLSLNNIPAGEWHLRINAKNQAGVVEYTGETNVVIIENTIVNLSLTLFAVSEGTGGIYIFVTWGERNEWKDGAEYPVLQTNHNPSSPLYVTQAKVIYDDGIYKMWYNALYNNAVASIWYAESQDGISWNTIGNQPVLTTGINGSWDAYSVTVLHVMKDNGTYKMYYHGFDQHPDYSSWRIGLAVSSDGKSWQKYQQPVLTDEGIYFQLGLTSIVKFNDTYFGYFEYTYMGKSCIGAAISTDGIEWTFNDSNPILSGSTSWDQDGVKYPTVIYDTGKFIMYFGNNSRTAFGYAESITPFNFSKNTRPIFKASDTKSNITSINYPVHFKVNNVNRIYYTGFYGTSPQGIYYIYK